jgi:hypothetical protein
MTKSTCIEKKGHSRGPQTVEKWDSRSSLPVGSRRHLRRRRPRSATKGGGRRWRVSMSPLHAEAVSGWKHSSEVGHRDCGVLGVITLLGASCLETRLGDPMLCYSDDHRCPRLLLNGAMYIIVGESKTVPLLGLAKSCYPLATSFTTSRVDRASTSAVSGSPRSSQVTGIDREAALVHSLGQVSFFWLL